MKRALQAARQLSHDVTLWCSSIVSKSRGICAGDARVSVGVVGGAFVKDLFDSESRSFFSRPFLGSSTGDAREKIYLVGPMVEVRLPFRLSAEFDAFYSRLNGEVYNSTAINGETVSVVAYTATANRWEFPLLAKYNIPTGARLHPFVGAGPSFSLLAQEEYRAAAGSGTTTTTQTNISRNARNSGTGLTVVGGLSWDYRHVRFAPQIRYTRRERNSFILPTSQDGVEAALSLSFGK